MQDTLVFRHGFKFSVKEPVISGDSTIFVDGGTYKGTFRSGGQQMYLFTDDAIMMGAKVVGCTDAAGTPLFTESGFEYDMYVNSSEPVVNVHGRIIGHRQVLRRKPPYDFTGVTHV